jgi:hypothetical protein
MGVFGVGDMKRRWRNLLMSFRSASTLLEGGFLRIGGPDRSAQRMPIIWSRKPVLGILSETGLTPYRFSPDNTRLSSISIA